MAGYLTFELGCLANRLTIAISINSSLKGGKRKAEESVDVFDAENVDPSIFSKRAKGSDENSFYPVKDFVKPSPFVLTRAPAPVVAPREILRPVKAITRTRTYLQPKSPAARINTAITKSTSLSAPAGRSPTRGSKRVGILSKRRTGSSFGRVDPPSFNIGSAAPFSLDAALKGTIPSYTGRTPVAPSSLLDDSGMKADWFFDIHEDTPEQEMTNLLQHSTCTLDISSDEESERKARRDRDEGRDKENVPPMDDVSQTQAARRMAAATPAGPDEMVFEKTRGALGELNAADYYAEGCDSTSVFIVAADEEEVEHDVKLETTQPATDIAPAPVLVAPEEVPLPLEADDDLASDFSVEADVSIDFLMGKVNDEPSSKAAAVLQPIEGTGESFDLWESGSFRDEAQPVVVPGSPRAEEEPQEENL